MAWTDGVDYSTGQLISASIWNNYLGAAGNIDLTAPGVVTTAGDTTYATGDNTLARLAKGTARQTLAMNSGATAPEWAASSRSVLTTAGDVMYASGTNTPARLAKGTARQNLTINSGATAPEWSASPASLMTAKADVLSTSAANTPARLGVGANDTVLTADSGESTGLKWAAAGGGKILQVVTDTGSVQYSTDSATLQTIDDPVASITPSNSSNKVLILATIDAYARVGDMIILDLQRAISGGATTSGLSGETHGLLFGESPDNATFGQTFVFLDSPSTTSACTYKMMFSNEGGSVTIYAGGANTLAVIVLMEVDGT